MAKESHTVDEFANHCMEGLSFRRNRNNGFVVVNLDFVADPAKRSTEWIDAERRRMPPKVWAVEMLRSWETYSGKPVYEGVFHKHLHVPSRPIKMLENQPILRGWDFGGNQSVVICQVQKNRLVVLDELPNRGQNTEQFAPEVIAFCNQNYPTFLYVDMIDPNGMWDTQRGKASASNADAMREVGLKPIPAPTQDPGQRVKGVTSLLMRLCDDGRPALLINPHCDMLIRGFEGGYHYPEKPSQRGKLVPVKNLFSHCLAGDTTFISTPYGYKQLSEIVVGDYVDTPQGFESVTAVMCRKAPVYSLEFSNGFTVECTGDHPFPTQRGIVFADDLCHTDLVWQKAQFTQSKNLTALNSIENQAAITNPIITRMVENTCTDTSGRTIMDVYQSSIISTTKITTEPTTLLKISNWFKHQFMQNITLTSGSKQTQFHLLLQSPQPEKQQNFGTEVKPVVNGTANMLARWPERLKQETAQSAELPTQAPLDIQNEASAVQSAKIVQDTALVLTTSNENVLYAVAPSLLTSIKQQKPAVKLVGKKLLGEEKLVYDLTVANEHCYFANNILTLNCHDALQYAAQRMKAYDSRDFDEGIDYERSLVQYKFY